jgi:hypothetical protein
MQSSVSSGYDRKMGSQQGTRAEHKGLHDHHGGERRCPISVMIEVKFSCVLVDGQHLLELRLNQVGNLLRAEGLASRVTIWSLLAPPSLFLFPALSLPFFSFSLSFSLTFSLSRSPLLHHHLSWTWYCIAKSPYPSV